MDHRRHAVPARRIGMTNFWSQLMQKILLFAFALSTGFADAAVKSTAIVAPALNPGTIDSLKLADSALLAQTHAEFETTLREQHQKDSILFSSHLPDAIRTKVEEAAKLFGQQKHEFDSLRLADPDRIEEFKSTVDRWRQTWEAKRDSQVAKIADPALRTTIQTRIAQITEKHASIFAQLRERRQAIQQHIDDLKARKSNNGRPGP
jgi:hypothetical protein